MLLTPSLKTELYTHYAFLPRCVPVPCEFRGDDTRWNCFNCINLIWDLVFLPASWNESDLHRDQHWQNIQCQAKDIMSPTLSRNVMWWKYICRLRKWLERLKIAKGCLHKHSVRSSVGGWKDEICTKCTLICTFLWRAPWRKHHFLLNSSNIKIYLHCKCCWYILLHPHYSMELFAH